ncbi:MAG: hypothetical protein OXG15_02020 [Gammaproteobacteria bacterium]|nr:hypothetical protein [Gammaproteobacteria bacterium]
MISAARRIPNFAGVALVDILANGVAVLIIVIVLSIASRFEQEKEYSERIQEVSAVMTREFSTSLVLNRLAAGPPATLHDYENSALDQVWDPAIMPVLEIHKDVVRDPYSGRVWHRSELLQEPNSLDAFLSEFDAFQRESVRGDFYDIGTFYLLMSILKDHSILITHWHFVGAMGIGQEASVASCPAGMSAKDCVGLGVSDQTSTIADVYESLTNGSGNGENQGDGEWPPSESEWDDIGQEGRASADSLPQGAQLGPGGSGDLDGESFPDVRASRNRQTGQGPGGAGNVPGFSIRLADPTAELASLGSINLATIQQDLKGFLISLMAFLSEIQHFYDNDNPPTELLQQFIPILQTFLTQPPTLDDIQLEVVEDLALSLELLHNQGYVHDQAEPLITHPIPRSAHPEALIRLAVNRTLIEAEIQSNNVVLLDSVPETAKLRFNLQAYPDIWRGMQISAERNAVLLMSPIQSEPDVAKWRAIAYLSPHLDDFVVGFVFGAYDEDGHLEIVAEPNQGFIDTMRLMPQWDRSPFSIQTWMTMLYVFAGLSLIALLFFWRPGTRFRR